MAKSYIYANGEVLMQHNGNYTADKYFYLHDRLGSVREVINTSGDVANYYSYDPWGVPMEGETQETISNPYRFAGYVWDSELSQYNCINRMYDPILSGFTSRDTDIGQLSKPITLHKYLYCANDPINKTDPQGLFGFVIGGELSFNGSEAGTFVGGVVKGVRQEFGGLLGGLGRGYSASMSIFAQQAYVMQAADCLFGTLGANVGAGTVFGYGNGKFYGGSTFWTAGGAGTGLSFSLGAIYAFSYNAKQLKDFAGDYMEYGASVSTYSKGPGIFMFPGIGGAITRDIGNDGISLVGIEFGAGIEEGVEGHVFRGHSWIKEW